MIHKCDNLELISRLQNECIDLIYSDVLFNTGKVFKDFSDKFSSIPEAIDWYQSRFVGMHRVLKTTGLLYIHCDHHLSHYLKVLLDQVFGMKNFRNEIIWHYNSAPRKKKDFGHRHDVIFRYSKSDVYTFNPIRIPYTASSPKTFKKAKYYHRDGKVLGDVWNINILGQNDKTERNGYSTQKPEKLLETIIKSSSNENDLIADFFMGSGTTLAVAKKLKRNYIGCDLSEKAYNITEQRLNKI
jgi:site-specific DNA-methyltransferase (adenine-specific)